MSLEEMRKFRDSGVVEIGFNLARPDQILDVPPQNVLDDHDACAKAIAKYASSMLAASFADFKF